MPVISVDQSPGRPAVAPPPPPSEQVAGTVASASDRRSDPRWVRPAFFVLLALTAFAYLWDLSASGYANSFYAAAVQAGTKSWKAFFFGSLDASNYITVDKPPAALWVMDLSARLFGFSSWSLLAPQALEGVAAVALLYASVRRWFGGVAGLFAGLLLAATPVAALMFRFDNPDALLVLLLVAGAYCLTRALERGATKWIVAVGACLGFAFLAKMLQAFTVLPAFALVYLIAAPVSARRRIAQLLAGLAAIVAAAGWWVAIVALWPAASRPFIDGSPDNSILNLIFGYNGLQRLYQSGGGSGGGPGSSFSGATGVFRLMNDLMGGQASWLLPVALLALVAGLIGRGRAPRTDRARAALLLWGGWLVVTGAVFSFGEGVIHTYYTVALAPAIAALVAIGGALAWPLRHTWRGRALATVAVDGTAAWAYVLLDRTPAWHPWLRVVVAACAVLATAGLLGSPLLGRLGRRVGMAAAGLALVATLSGPVAYAAATVTTAHTGSIPSAGPASANGGGGGFGGGGGARGGGPAPAGQLPGGLTGRTGASGAFPGGSGRPGGSTGASSGRPGGSAPSGASQTPTGASGSHTAAPTGSSGGGAGGTSVSTALRTALRADASRYRWVAATDGSQDAATIELATGEPVMAIGGFNGEGGNLTLAQFERYVAAGDIHYYLASGGQGGAGGSTGSSQITAWVESHYKAVTIGGQTVYDLTSATS